MLGRSALVFVLGFAFAQENNAPPTVNALLERWADAMGGRETIEHITSIYRAGVTTEDGLKGTIEDWVTATGRHKQIRAREGLDTTLTVFDGDHGWVRDWNGKVHALAGADVKNELSEALQASYSYLKRGGAHQWSLLGEDETREFYVLQLAPPQGRAISFHLNKATGLPAKLQRANGDNTLTVDYDDWRVVADIGGIGGVKLPFRMRRNTGDPRADVGISLATIRLNGSLPKGTFRKPQDTARDSRFTSGRRAASVPFTQASNFILIQAQVNRSRPLWFLLDTGASITVINKDRAQELGLALHGDLALGTSGGSTGFSITKGVSFSVPGAEVADQTVGAISLSAFEAGFGLPIGGILGYDFISRFVVELDFEAKRVNLYAPQSYRYRGPGEAIPLTLEDENNPFVQAEIGLPDGRTIAGTFEIDTGETKALFLNTPFVKSHQLLESARDSQAITGSRASEKQFFAGLSAGGQVERLKMGRFVIEKPPAGLSLEGGGFVSNADYAGLIGNAILSRFKVILDYSRLRMILEPNARLKEPFAPRRSATVDLHAPVLARAMEQIHPAALRAHISFLADDLLEGRGTATRGHEIAARYVAAHFEIAGLEPGANGGWLQQVPLRRSELDPAASCVEIIGPGGERTALVFARDYVMSGDFRESTEIEAPVVFVGYGITAPELHHDDYAGVDAHGKIVAFLGGGPPELRSEERAYYSTLKSENAAAHGAVGSLLLTSPDDEKTTSWDVVVHSLAAAPSFAWLDGGAPHGFLPQLRGGAWLGLAGSRALFGGAGRYAELVAKAVPAELPLRVRIVKKSRISAAQSPNVVGLLRGSDPQLRDEVVVFSAHADHLGIGEPVNGDAIYNGAVDDASGVAALLELARAFAALPERPRRSLLFVAMTGEEPGLLGSDYFVHHPPVPLERIVADLNIDGAAVWPFESLIARGAEHSTLARAVAAAAMAAGLPIIPDPFPERMSFLGSDQYSFVQRGIPSLILGTRGSGDARALALQWVKTRYHTPSDDLSQPMNFEAAARLTRVLFLIGYGVAQDDARPRWNPGDFYGEHAK